MYICIVFVCFLVVVFTFMYVCKSVGMVFSKDTLIGCWKRGEYNFPIMLTYIWFLGIEFSSKRVRDMHIRKLLDNDRRELSKSAA